MDTGRTSPAFTRVDWASDHLDGLVRVALLQSEGIPAFLPYENFARQDWFALFAYGGFPIFVPSDDAQGARELLAAYRHGNLALDECDVDTPPCPRCASQESANDPRPRRWVFGVLLLAQILLGLLFLVSFFPGALRRIILRRYRCPACGASWQTSNMPGFARLQADAQT
jgi:hypothetical protein